jgi:hypothetical protein
LSLISQFHRLNADNKRLVLDRNTPLYIQLCLGTYLSQDHVKLEDVTNYQSPPDFPSNFVNFKHLNSRINLFRPDTNLDEYGSLVNQLRVITQINRIDQKALLAYATLFDCDESVTLSDNEGLEDTNMMSEIMFDAQITTSSTHFDKKDLIQIISRMALFCTYHINWEDSYPMARLESAANNVSSISMPFTMEEEGWINNQIKQVGDAFRSVPAGKFILHEFFMHSLGVPLSKNYMPNVFR